MLHQQSAPLPAKQQGAKAQAEKGGGGGLGNEYGI